MTSTRLGAVIGTIAVAALVGCGTSGGSKATTTSRPTTTQRQTTTTEARTTTTTAATTTTSGLATPQDWLNKYTDEWLELATILGDLPTTINTSDEAQVAALQKSCTALDDWATRIDESDAVPDPDLDAELGNLIEDAWAFSEDCLDAIDQKDLDLLEQAIAHLRDYQGHVERFASGIG